MFQKALDKYKMEVEIQRIQIARMRHGSDTISIVTTVPAPDPFEEVDYLTFDFHVPRGQAEEFLRSMDVPEELIELTDLSHLKTHKFSKKDEQT